MIKIRVCEAIDIEPSLPLVAMFYEESLKEYGLTFSTEALQKVMEEHVKAKSSLVMLQDDMLVGVIAGKIANVPFSDYKIFQETLWYVLPKYRGHGLKLFRECEKYCKSIGISSIVMGNMANLNAEKMDKFYYSQGYKLMEKMYVKAIHS